MWIEPNGRVKILTHIDLDNEYDNTIFFQNRLQQYNYFNSKAKYAYNKITYQRVKRNYIRVEINAENLYDCNYLMFQNTSFGDRWFYAFITKVEYLSNMVSEIEYEIDVIQTWLLDCVLNTCFVEREHSLTDTYGENKVEENLEYGEYVIKQFNQSNLIGVDIPPEEGSAFGETGMKIVVATSKVYSSGAFRPTGPDVFTGIPTVLGYEFFDLNTPGLALFESWVAQLTSADSIDAIYDVFLCPREFIQDRSQDDPFEPVTLQYTTLIPDKIGTYEPRNKKVLQSPYNILMVTDLRGNDAEYQYEFFNANLGANITFEYALGLSCDPSMQLIPLNYKDRPRNYNEQMIYKGFPHLSWATDRWSMYLAQNGGIMPTIQKDVMGSVLPMIAMAGLGAGMLATGGVGVAGASAIGAISSVGKNIGARAMLGSSATKVATSMQQLKHHYRQPPSASGNFNGDIITANGSHDFWFAKLQITEEFAQRIDEYFDMFGYATKRLKIPNISSRPHWNYIKTGVANITGDIPADDLSVIKNIFNNGITFWKNGDAIGNYALDNRPVNNS